MIKLNIDSFSDEYKDVAPKEAAMYLSACFSDEELEKIKDNWNKDGGYKVTPWWQYLLNHLTITYES